MGFLSTILNVVGLTFLAHAVYSAYEHSLSHSSPSDLDIKSDLASLPTDIVIETLFSVSLLCVGIVLASPSLRPIEWRVWAEQVEKDERRPKGQRQFENDGGVVPINPYRWLEERKGFWDVRGNRKEFADWVRAGAGKEK